MNLFFSDLFKRFLIVITFFILFSQNSFAQQKLSLTESIGLAIKNNPAITSSQEKVSAARADLTEAYSKWYPNLSFEYWIGTVQLGEVGTYITTSEGTNPFQVRIGIDESAQNTVSKLKLTQPIFTFGKLINATRIASGSIDFTNLELEESKSEITFNVKNVYFSLLKARKLMGLSSEAKKIMEDHYGQVKKAYGAGLITKPDLIKVELELAMVEQNSIKGENGVELAKLAFNNILSSREADSYEIKDEDFLSYEKYPDANYGVVLREAGRSRLDLQKIDVLKRMTENKRNLMLGYYFPDFGIQADYGWERITYEDFQFDSKNYHVLLGATWTLFNGFETAAKVNKAQAELEQLKANESLLRKKIEVELKETLLSLKDSIKRVENSKKSVGLAEENFNITKKKYDAGSGTSLEFIYAQRDLIQAKKDLIEAQFDLEIAKAKLNKLSGKEII